MTVEDIQVICRAFPGMTQDIKWENHLCFNVGGKMFIVTSPDTFPVTASFKVSEENFEELPAREGFKPAPYLARNKWIYVDDISRLTRKEWKQYLEEAYRLIASKLPAKTRRALKIEVK
jgi:predicted DNA-binding protein (MmcQ/YjbR family)